MMQKNYGDECVSRSTIYEWFKRFILEGQEDLNDDERSGRPRSAVNEENVEIVREFINNKSKFSFRRTKRSMLCFILVLTFFSNPNTVPAKT